MNHERRQGIPVAAGHLAWLAGFAVVVLVGCGGDALPSRAPQEPAPNSGSNGAPVAEKLPAARSLALPALPAIAPPSPTVSATLAWDASPDAGKPSFGGYILYWQATNDGVEITGNRVVGNVTTATITNLLRGVRYTFRATAYNVTGDESPFSNEAIFPVPRTNYVTFGFKTNGVVAFQWTYTNPPGDVVLFTPFVAQTNNDVSVLHLPTNSLKIQNP